MADETNPMNANPMNDVSMADVIPAAPTQAVAAANFSAETDLEAVYEIPVEISVVLGETTMTLQDLLRLAPGNVIELERKIGEPVDVYVNGRLVARGEIVVVEEHIGITMTEIIKTEK